MQSPAPLQRTALATRQQPWYTHSKQTNSRLRDNSAPIWGHKDGSRVLTTDVYNTIYRLSHCLQCAYCRKCRTIRENRDIQQLCITLFEIEERGDTLLTRWVPSVENSADSMSGSVSTTQQYPRLLSSAGAWGDGI
jgi:hypothetical protein